MPTKIAALCGVGSGCLILAVGGGEAPAWLRCLLVLFFGSLALVYGFTAFVPGCPKVLTSPPVVGVVCVWAGAAVMWVPSNVLVSCALVGFGTRLLMIEHKKEEQHGPGSTGTELCRRSGELARREPSSTLAHWEEG